MDYINGYALALFALAKESGKLKLYKDQSLEIVQATKENEDYLVMLDLKSVPIKERLRMVEKAFGFADKDLLNFLYILVQKSKAKLVIGVLEKLVRFINEELKINEGVVYTKEKLSSQALSDITLKAARRLKLEKLSLVNKLDREIVSGFKVVVGDEIIEDTIASRLDSIKVDLLQGREI